MKKRVTKQIRYQIGDKTQELFTLVANLIEKGYDVDLDNDCQDAILRDGPGSGCRHRFCIEINKEQEDKGEYPAN